MGDEPVRLPARSSLGWVSRDGWLVIGARGLMNFSLASMAVMLAAYLDLLEFGVAQIGGFVSAGVAGAAFFVILGSFVEARVGRRRLMVIFGALPVITITALLLSDSFAVLTVFAFFGAMAGGGQGGGGSPAQPMEMAALPDTTVAERRTDLFAVYRMVWMSGAALGALSSGVPALIEDLFGTSEETSFKAMFLVLGVLFAAAAFLYVFLSPRVEVKRGGQRWVNPLKLPSRRIIFTFNGLKLMDDLASSLLVQSLVAFWFISNFGIELRDLAFIFFGHNALIAISLLLAPWVARRIGLLNTMVCTQILSDLPLIAIPLAPTAWLAVLIWELRAFMAMMDVPTRDSYTMAIVGPEERVAMASFQIVGRSAVTTAGPSISSALWTAISASVPFIAAGTLKIAYSMALFFTFRNVRPPEELLLTKARGVVAGAVSPTTISPEVILDQPTAPSPPPDG